jgi:hypothetical protein
MIVLCVVLHATPACSELGVPHFESLCMLSPTPADQGAESASNLGHYRQKVCAMCAVLLPGGSCW